MQSSETAKLGRRSAGSTRWQFIAFVFVGAFAAIVSLVARWAINHFVPFEIAVALAQVVGMIVAFYLNRRLVFVSKDRLSFEFGRFSAVNVASLALATGVSSLCYRFVLPALGIYAYADVIAQLIGIASCTLPSFFAHKLFSFSGATPGAADR